MSAVDRRLTELITADGPIAVTEPVIIEVLAGRRRARPASKAGTPVVGWMTVSPAGPCVPARALSMPNEPWGQPRAKTPRDPVRNGWAGGVGGN